jgi:ketosteroid isomerase-like protein
MGREAASDRLSREEGNMDTFLKIMAGTSVVIALVFLLPRPVVLAMTQILPEAKVEGDPQSINELVGTFDRAQESIRSRDLDALMSLYAQNYDYHGLKKVDIRKIWEELFAHYDFIANIHTFSAIKIVSSANGATAEITCTGSLWARSEETKQRIPIDSWHQEVHHLVREKDGWRIVGNLGGEPVIRQFGSAPHPLF